MSNLVLRAFVHLVDRLTCGNLDYRDKRHGSDSRTEAAARLFDQVQGSDGHYWVRSDEHGKRITYRVYIGGDDFSCECPDYWANPHHICKHVLSAMFVDALQAAFADEEAPPEPVPLREYLQRQTEQQRTLDEDVETLWGEVAA